MIASSTFAHESGGCVAPITKNETMFRNTLLSETTPSVRLAVLSDPTESQKLPTPPTPHHPQLVQCTSSRSTTWSSAYARQMCPFLSRPHARHLFRRFALRKPPTRPGEGVDVARVSFPLDETGLRTERTSDSREEDEDVSPRSPLSSPDVFFSVTTSMRW